MIAKRHLYELGNLGVGAIRCDALSAADGRTHRPEDQREQWQRTQLLHRRGEVTADVPAHERIRGECSVE